MGNKGCFQGSMGVFRGYYRLFQGFMNHSHHQLSPLTQKAPLREGLEGREEKERC